MPICSSSHIGVEAEPEIPTDSASSKKRGDGTKDDWAIAVLKIRRRGMRREAILLDGKRFLLLAPHSGRLGGSICDKDYRQQ